jgi:predicted TIM-barrel fold metal-dependent hydrolase
LAAHLQAYGDYLYKRIYLKAGELQRPIIIHTVVVLHPALRIDFNDPKPLYAVFMDPDVVRAGTQFILIHTGFPAHAEVAAMMSQFPNVYVDLSHISKYPGALEETLRVLMGVGPVAKIMYGSDSGSIPEETGYCVWNTRSVLARILNDYHRYYGWTQADVSDAAHQILSGTARRIFEIRG